MYVYTCRGESAIPIRFTCHSGRDIKDHCHDIYNIGAASLPRPIYVKSDTGYTKRIQNGTNTIPEIDSNYYYNDPCFYKEMGG